MKLKLPLMAVLLVALCLRVFLAFAVPTASESHSRGLSWYNDERAHLNYVRYLAKEKAFPVQTNSVQLPGAFARGDFEYYQPPLAYLALVPAWKLGESVQPGLGWLFARLLDSLFGVATVLVAWGIVRKLAPGTEIWAAWLLASQPGLCYQGALASNDPLFWLLGAMFLLKTMDFADGGPAWSLAPLAAALLLTKSSGLTLLPLPFLALLPLARYRSLDFNRGKFSSRRFLELAMSLGAGALLASPWYLRSHHLYGSWMALQVGHGAPWPVLDTLTNFEVLKMLVLYFSISVWYPLDLAWSILPWPRAFFALGSLVWISPLVVGWPRFRDPLTWIPWEAILLGLASMFLYAIRYRQSEARLLFHLFPAFVALWAVAVGPRTTRWGMLALIPSVLTWAWVGIRFFHRG